MSVIESATNFTSSIGDSISSGFNSLTSNSFGGPLRETYRPKNAFSFKILRRNENGSYDLSKINSTTIPEYFLTVGPLQYNESFKFRNSIDPTFGGTAVTDFGIGNSEIRLEGEFHIYHNQLPPKSKSDIEGGDFLSAGKSAIIGAGSSYYDKIRNTFLNFSGGEMRSGLQEFQDLLYFFYFSRYEDVRYTSNDETANLIAGIPEAAGGFNYAYHALIFRDYDRGRIVEVIIPSDGFSITRSVQDTNTYKYSIKLVVIKDLEKDIKSPLVRSNFNPEFRIAGLMNELETLINLPLRASSALVSSARFFDNTITSARALPGTFNRMKKQFSQDGKLARKTFQNAIDQTRSAFGFGKKKHLSIEEISKKIDDTYKESRLIEAKFRQEIAKVDANLSGLISALGGYALGTSRPLEQEALLPNANSTPLLDEDAYTWAVSIQNIIIQVQAEMNYASSEPNYNIYNISSGDTYEKIAQELLGNKELAGALALWNNDEIKQELTRQAIKIPFGTNTGIFSSLPEAPTGKDLEIGLIGTDIKLTEQRDVAVAPNGDLGLVEGNESLINNILDIIDTPIESWTLYPDLGNPIPIGEIVNDLRNSDYLQNLISQIRSDSRIKTARLNRVIQNGDRYLILIDITSMSGENFTIQL